MTTSSAPEWMREPVDMGDVPPEIVLAALYDVAGAPGMGTMDPQHSAEPMFIDEARWRVEAAGAVINEDYTRGRLMKLRSEGTWLDVGAYNRDNADGRPLAQAVLAEVTAVFGAGSSLAETPTADAVCAAARRAASEFDLGIAWRNTAVHSPTASSDLVQSLFRACDVAGIETPFDVMRIAQMRFQHAVSIWTMVDQLARTQGGEPLAHLESVAELMSRIGSPEAGAGLDPFIEHLVDTAHREAAAGTTWADMPRAFEAALVEYAVASAVPSRGFDSGSIPPLGKR